MTGDQAPPVPPRSAVPAPRRPAPAPVWALDSSGSAGSVAGRPGRETQPQLRVPARRPLDAAFNSRDLEVLSGLARGRSTAQIASSLSVSRNTARTRIRRVQRKLAVGDRIAAVRAARGLGILAGMPGYSAPG
jgi:DNA-binding NarL/FixJ family response regulator